MNYYKLQFNKKSKAYSFFFVAVSVNYGIDLWRPDESSVWVISTPDSGDQVLKKLDVSRDCPAIGLRDASDLDVKLTTARFEDADLPDDAKRWLAEQMEVRANINELTSKPLGPGYKPLA